MATNIRPYDFNHHNNDWAPIGRPGNRSDLKSGPAILFFCFFGLLFIFVLFYFIHIYFLSTRAIYYTVIDHEDPSIHHLRRVVPFREWLRKKRGKPRSASDTARDDDFERVQRMLDVQNWRGPVNTNGTPDLRTSISHEIGNGQPWGYDHQVNGGVAETVNHYEPWSQNTQIWNHMSQDQRSGIVRNWSFHDSSVSGSAPATTTSNQSVQDNHDIQHSAAANIPITNNSCHLLSTQPITNQGYGTLAPNSLNMSPRGTHMTTPPTVASRQILGLESPNYSISNIPPPKPLKFRNLQLAMHYDSLCAAEALASMKLRRAKVRAQGSERVSSEVLVRMEMVFRECAKKRALFGERWSTESNLTDGSTPAPLPEVSPGEDLPPPYSEVDPHTTTSTRS